MPILLILGVIRMFRGMLRGAWASLVTDREGLVQGFVWCFLIDRVRHALSVLLILSRCIESFFCLVVLVILSPKNLIDAAFPSEIHSRRQWISLCKQASSPANHVGNGKHPESVSCSGRRCVDS